MNTPQQKYYIVYKYSIVLLLFMRNNFFTLKQQINEVLLSIAHKWNNTMLRALVETKIHQILNQYKCDGTIIDYNVVCDERNNPCSVVENNNIIANINWVDIFKQKHYYEANFQNIIKDKHEI